MTVPGWSAKVRTVTTTQAERILRMLSAASRPMDDDEIAARMGVARQNVNQICRRLELQGAIQRGLGLTGKIVNSLPGIPPPPRVQIPTQVSRAGPTLISEDDVKRAVRSYLEARGLSVEVDRSVDRGIEIVAAGAGERWVIDAVGEVAGGQQRDNHFLAALGQLIQHMDDPQVRYALALPDNHRHRELVSRLPELARTRLGLTVLFVDLAGAVREDTP